ncbi:MAG: hypothetical protein ACLQNV_23950, partial [Steroidobacteraceae bacterium]
VSAGCGAGMTSRTQPPRYTDTEATVFGHARGRRQRNDQMNFFTIAEVAERLRQPPPPEFLPLPKLTP